ncbi:unnamed protein product [Penicillium pancosmium]
MEGAIRLSLQTLADGFFFGESPRYQDGMLYMSDMTGCKIVTIDVSTGTKDVLVEVENQPNGMCFADDDTIVYSSMFDTKLHRYSLKDKSSTLYADMSHVMTGYSGDMVIDKVGRVYLDDTGARVLHGEEPRPGRIIRVDTNKSVHVVEEDVVFPNAIFISPDGNTLYNAETFRYGLLKFDISDKDGSLSNRQNVWSPATIAGDRGASKDSMIGIDGGCMDADGGMWLSLLALEEFVRLSPDGLQITHRIKTNGHATACTLGGNDGKTLFLVTNWVPEGEELFSAMTAKRTRCTSVANALALQRPQSRASNLQCHF